MNIRFLDKNFDIFQQNPHLPANPNDNLKK